MRFLADESCDFTFVRVLRAAGHDVMAVAEAAPAPPTTRLSRSRTSSGAS